VWVDRRAVGVAWEEVNANDLSAEISRRQELEAIIF
jgi:hypothetical protein